MWHQMLFKETLMQLHGSLCSCQKFLAFTLIRTSSGVSIYLVSFLWVLSVRKTRNMPLGLRSLKKKKRKRKLWFASLLLISSPFYITAVFKNSYEGRLHFFWFTYGIVNWFYKYMIVQLLRAWIYSNRHFNGNIFRFFKLSFTFLLLVTQEISPSLFIDVKFSFPFLPSSSAFCHMYSFFLYSCPHSVHSENAELSLFYNFSSPSPPPPSFLFLSKLICPATWSLRNLVIIEYIKPGS